jgi:multisubunit Na+/H+ antiporter MnhG subunit
VLATRQSAYAVPLVLVMGMVWLVSGVALVRYRDAYSRWQRRRSMRWGDRIKTMFGMQPRRWGVAYTGSLAAALGLVLVIAAVANL